MKLFLLALTLVTVSFSSSANAWDAKSFQKPSEDKLKKQLSPMQYDVTQNEGTEPPYHNEYFDNHEAGIYLAHSINLTRAPDGQASLARWSKKM
jgi:hypothetical protein